MTLRDLIPKLLAGALALVAFFYVGYQLFRFVGKHYRTETAYEYVVEDTLAATGLMIREERIIRPEVQGVMAYDYENGDRVGKNQVVAHLYESEADAVRSSEIRALDGQIQLLEASGDADMTGFSQVEAISEQIHSRINEIVKIRAGTASPGDLQTLQSELLTQLNRRLIAIGQLDSFEDILDELEAEREALEGELEGEVIELTTPATGYFAGSIDGLEGLCTTEMAGRLTPENLEKWIDLAATIETDESCCKVITGYEWIFAIPVEAADVGRFTEGRSIQLAFPFVDTARVPVTVEAVLEDASTGGAVVLLSGNQMSADLASLRTQTVQVIFRSYTGLRIDTDAIRFDGTTPGVLVEGTTRIQFKRIDTIYEGAGFILSRISDDSDFVRLYDEVVVEGSNVYVGMSTN